MRHLAHTGRIGVLYPPMEAISIEIHEDIVRFEVIWRACALFEGNFGIHLSRSYLGQITVWLTPRTNVRSSEEVQHDFIECLRYFNKVDSY